MKKNRIFAMLLCGILLLCFTACGNAFVPEPSPAPAPEETTFSANILEILEGSLLVQPVEGSWILQSSDQISVSLADAALQDQEGSEITTEDMYLGGLVTVTFDGEIAESYPAQVTASTIVFDTTSPRMDTPSIVNPMVELDGPDFLEYTGFALVGLPNRDDLRAEKFYAYVLSDHLDENIAEVYLRGEASDQITMRVANDSGSDISGVYEDFSQSEEYKFKDTIVTVKWNDNNVLATWTYYGYAFSTYLMNCNVEDALYVIEELSCEILIAVT